MTRLELFIKEFKDKNFAEADKEWHFRKLCEEVGELGEALMRGDKTEINMEMGDVGIVLAGLGICMDQSLASWMATAMDKNVARIKKNKKLDKYAENAINGEMISGKPTK